MILKINRIRDLVLFGFLVFAVVAAATAAVILAACGLDDAAQHVHQRHGNDGEHHNHLDD